MRRVELALYVHGSIPATSGMSPGIGQGGMECGVRLGICHHACLEPPIKVVVSCFMATWWSIDTGASDNWCQMCRVEHECAGQSLSFGNCCCNHLRARSRLADKPGLAESSCLSAQTSCPAIL